MLKKYKCYCGHEFTCDVNYLPAAFHQREKNCGLSTQVKCPKCLNFIPTWERQETGKLVGRKHIHIRR